MVKTMAWGKTWLIVGIYTPFFAAAGSNKRQAMDTTALLQTASTVAGQGTGGEGFAVLFDRADVQERIKHLHLETPSPRFAELAENGALEHAFAMGRRKTPLPDALEEPPEVAHMAAEVETMMRSNAWAPRGANEFVLLEQKKLFGNMSVPRGKGKQMQAELMKFFEKVRMDNSMIKTAVNYIPKLYVLTQDQSLFKPLKKSFETLRGQAGTSLNPVAEHCPALVESAASAVGKLGVMDLVDEQPKISTVGAANGGPNLDLATLHGFSYGDESGRGWTGSFQIGFLNTLWMLEPELDTTGFAALVTVAGKSEELQGSVTMMMTWSQKDDWSLPAIILEYRDTKKDVQPYKGEVFSYSSTSWMQFGAKTADDSFGAKNADDSFEIANVAFDSELRFATSITNKKVSLSMNPGFKFYLPFKDWTVFTYFRFSFPLAPFSEPDNPSVGVMVYKGARGKQQQIASAIGG